MIGTELHRRPDAIAMIARAGLLGLWTGAGIGALAGSLVVPVVGTIIGAVVGCAFGGLVGLGNGLVLAALVACTRPPQVVVRLVACMVSGALTALLSGAAAGAEGAGTAFSVPVATVGALLGLGLGPQALRTAEPAWSPVGVSVARGARTGVLVGSVAGGMAGLYWGLHVHPSTAWFAALEIGAVGAIVGVTVGATLGGAAAVRAWRQPRHHRGHPA